MLHVQQDDHISHPLIMFTAITFLGSSVEVKSLPSSLPDPNLPPPIPSKHFLEEKLSPPPPKQQESGYMYAICS